MGAKCMFQVLLLTKFGCWSITLNSTMTKDNKDAQSVLTLEKNILDAVKHADLALIFSINLLISHDGLGGLGGLGGP